MDHCLRNNYDEYFELQKDFDFLSTIIIYTGLWFVPSRQARCWKVAVQHGFWHLFCRLGI